MNHRRSRNQSASRMGKNDHANPNRKQRNTEQARTNLSQHVSAMISCQVFAHGPDVFHGLHDRFKRGAVLIGPREPSIPYTMPS